MIRFAWLQARTQTAVAAAALVAAAILLALTGPHLVDLYRADVATCATRGDCSTALTSFLRNDSALRSWLGFLVIAVPGVIGIFWGAPLVARELEAGTFRLAWTQSVTRTRWSAVKLGLVGLLGAAVAGLLSLVVTWWASPLDRAYMNRFAPGNFDERGIVAAGYAAFAFALGATAGVVIRRTLPAMVTTVVAFIGARLAFSHWVRPRLMAPAHQDLAIKPSLDSTSIVGVSPGSAGPNTLQLGSPHLPNAWVTSAQLVDRAGHAITARYMQTACPLLGAGAPAGGAPPGGGVGLGSSQQRTQVPAAAQAALQNCIAKVATTYHEAVVYQPANRYWTFQAYELAIFLGTALIMAGACIWLVRRRLS